MASEDITINLDEFIKYFLKKWKIVILLVVLCTGAFVGATKIFGEEISVPHSEEYLYYEQEAAWLEQYLNESVLMQMNPTNISEITLYLENVEKPKKVKDYIFSKEFWDALESERNKKYFSELLTWEDENGISVKIRHVTEKECIEAAEYIGQKIWEYDEKILVSAGELRVVTDEELQDEQLRWYDRIEYSNTLLLEAEAGYTIKVNVLAAAATGVLTGGILSVIAVLFMYMIQRKKDNRG